MLQKGDLLLKVNEASLDGLTHSQAVATLKATISLSSVSLTIMEVRTCLELATTTTPTSAFTIKILLRQDAKWVFNIKHGK